MKKSYLENIGNTPIDGKKRGRQSYRKLRHITYVRAVKLLAYTYMAMGQFEFARKIRAKQKF